MITTVWYVVKAMPRLLLEMWVEGTRHKLWAHDEYTEGNLSYVCHGCEDDNDD